MRLVPLVLLAAAAAPVHAQVATRLQAMTAADDDVCDLLRSDKLDRCRELARADSATVYQSGTGTLRRLVLAIRAGDATLIGPSIDLAAGDATLVATTPTVRSVQIDGRPGMVLDVVAKFRAARETWQTESIVGCGQTAAGTWKCEAIDVGRCAATIDGEARLTTACGDRTQLSLAQ